MKTRTEFEMALEQLASFERLYKEAAIMYMIRPSEELQDDKYIWMRKAEAKLNEILDDIDKLRGGE